jgi:hypothetical protein
MGKWFNINITIAMEAIVLAPITRAHFHNTHVMPFVSSPLNVE